MQGPVKVWHKDPRFLTDYYKPGMDLGPPDKEYQPESLVKPGERVPQVPKARAERTASPKPCMTA